MTTDSPSTAVEALAERVWKYRLDHEPFYRLNRGLPVEKLRTGSIAEVAEEEPYTDTGGLAAPTLSVLHGDSKIDVSYHRHRVRREPESTCFRGDCES